MALYCYWLSVMPWQTQPWIHRNDSWLKSSNLDEKRNCDDGTMGIYAKPHLLFQMHKLLNRPVKISEKKVCSLTNLFFIYI